MARVRLVDVAQRAGVSTATVSLVLNEAPARISESTAQAVRAAAREMGYRPDLTARSLRRQRTQMIGLVSDLIVTTPHAVRIVQGAQEVAWEQDNILVIANSEDDQGREAELIEALGDRRVDGYLLASMYHRHRAIPAALRGAPVVGVDIELDHGLPCYVPDERAGAAAATALLLEAGHRRIGHLQGRPMAAASALRAEAFRDSLGSAGCFDAGLVLEHSDQDSRRDSLFGEWAGRELLTRRDRPTAIFAFNDAMAMGVYRAAADLGLRVPDDVSVVGFDDHELVARELRPELTTVALPHLAMGRQATQHLLDLVNGRARQGGIHLLGCPLVVRQSVAPPPKITNQ